MDIHEVTVAALNNIINNRFPLGLYYAVKYICVDNSTGDAWTEEFDDFQTCEEWLYGCFEVGDE